MKIVYHQDTSDLASVGVVSKKKKLPVYAVYSACKDFVFFS
jgi:hypothetical protein